MLKIRRLVVLVAALSASLALANIGTDDEGSKDPSYGEAVKAVEAKDWAAAISALKKALEKDKFNADIHNLLGFSYRNAGNYETAFKHYEEAIKLNPKHRNAHEYLGEAYLLTNDLDKAKEQFRNLERLCPRGCEQMDMLKKKIEEYQQKSASN